MDKKAPHDLQQLRKQLALIGVGKIPDSWSQYLNVEPIEKKQKALLKVGMSSSTAYRIVKADFFNKKRSSILDNHTMIDQFICFLNENSEIGFRSRDSYQVPGTLERERARIITHPWNTIFEMFNAKLISEGQSKISKNSLRKIRKAHCKNFRIAAKFDIEYAQCSNCSQVDMIVSAMQKNRYLKDWNVSKMDLLNFSVCNSGNDACIWNKCQDCSFEKTLEKIISLIPNFNEIKNQMINFPELVQYSKGKGSSKTTKWIQQISTIKDFSVEITNVLFCSSSKATGSKVIFCTC